MRTILMNPRKTRSSARRAPVTIVRVAANPSLPMMNNPRRRKRRSNPKRRASGRTRVILMNPRRRRMRRNGPPMIMPNPRRGRRRRSGLIVVRNPSMNWKAAAMSAGIGLVAAGGSYLLNRYVIAQIGYKRDQHWNSVDNRRGILYRGALRFAGAMLGCMFAPGQIGASIAGAMTYPAVSELANWWVYRDAGTTSTADYMNPAQSINLPPAGTQAALENYEASLEAALQGYGYGR